MSLKIILVVAGVFVAAIAIDHLTTQGLQLPTTSDTTNLLIGGGLIASAIFFVKS